MNPRILLFITILTLRLLGGTLAAQTAPSEGGWPKERSLPSPPVPGAKFKTNPHLAPLRGLNYCAVDVGVAAGVNVPTNVGANLRFDPSAWLSFRGGRDLLQDWDWAFALEGEFSFHQPNARIQSILGIPGFDARSDLDVYNFGLNIVGKWNAARDWQLSLGIGPVISHIEARNARFILNGVNQISASASDTELGF